jgi:DNA repair exonuclease SbcCD ATPase subunit
LESLKKQFLELLEKDLEFRYTVAGYLGLSEILRRLEKIAEEQTRLREEQARLMEEQTRLTGEQIELRKEQTRLREDFNKILLRIEKMEERMERIEDRMERMEGRMERMEGRMERMEGRLGRVERTLEKLTIDVEDEAKSILKVKLRELGITLELTSLILPGLEINIYGASDDTCVIGEATVRAGPKLVDELLGKIEKLKTNYPNLLRKKVILVIYASLPMIELIEKSKEKGIWLLKATEEFFKPDKIFHEV